MKKNNFHHHQKLTTALLLGLLALSPSALVIAQTFNDNTEVAQFSQAEVEQVLAPIALYPDTLLTHILIASTYPIEVIEADRFLSKNKHLSDDLIKKRADKKEWDPSVKALVVFPQILEKLSEDLSWMRKLGDAFLNNEQQVLASIQTLRHKADTAGSLYQMDNVDIVREKQTIVIESSQPEVIYVPYYDPRSVYGHWHWSHYPPVYWHRPVHYSYSHGPFYWHTSVHIGVDFFFSAFHWTNHHIVRHHHKNRYHWSNKRISRSHHAKRWNHNPKHRRGVAYRSQKVKQRYVSHTQAGKKYRVTHHKNVMQPRLNNKKVQRNKAIRVNKHKDVSQQLKRKGATQQVAKNVNRNERFKSAPGRIAIPENTKRQLKANNHKSQINKQHVAKGKQKTFYRDTWKKEKRIAPIQPKHYASHSDKKALSKQSVRHTEKQYSRKKDYSKNQYRSKGSHSNKKSMRVANSSRNTKSHNSRSRQKQR